MGTPEFAVPVLSALVDEGHNLVGVYTQPDRPTGRGKRLAAPPVKRFAIERGLRVFQPQSLKADVTQQELISLSLDVVVVAAYRLFLPSKILSAPRWGCLNIHPSLLPRYRGPSPVAGAILNSDAVTGVTVMKIDEGMDSGPIVAQRETPIGDQETAEELTARLFEEGAALLVEVLPSWTEGDVQPAPQDESQATVTSRLSKEYGDINWTSDAETIARQVRAYRPWPGTYTRWDGKLLKITEAVASQETAPDTPATGLVTSLADRGVGAVTGHGILELRSLQLEGRREAAAADFVLGHSDFVGSILG